MKQYEPPEECWNTIGNSIEEERKSSVFARLDTYSPSDEIWENIDRHLSGSKPGIHKKTIIYFLKWASAVAAIVVLGFLIFRLAGNRENSLTYSEEWITGTGFQNPTGEDSLSYLTLDRKCRIQPEICQSIGFAELKKELDFLDESKKTIIKRLNIYDQDKELEVILTRIDIQREEIIGQLIEFYN